MDSSSDPPAVDPPAYTASAPVPPTTTRRTIEDTRALIIANASVLKPRSKGHEPFELVIGKTRSAAEIAAANNSGTRSFTSERSNVTIRINDPPQAANPDANTERRPSENAGSRVGGQHYAALGDRVGVSSGLNVLLRGEPQDTIEEALEWLLDRTEVLIHDKLSKRRPEMG